MRKSNKLVISYSTLRPMSDPALESVVRRQLQTIADLMQYGQVDHCNAELTADDHTVRFQGAESAENFRAIANALGELPVEDLHVTCHYCAPENGTVSDIMIRYLKSGKAVISPNAVYNSHEVPGTGGPATVIVARERNIMIL